MSQISVVDQFPNFNLHMTPVICLSATFSLFFVKACADKLIALSILIHWHVWIWLTSLQ